MILVITAVDDSQKVKSLAREIVERKLAACVSFFQVQSTYYWKGKICEEGEYMLFIKTLEKNVDDLIDWLKKNHPYTAPEIVTINTRAHGKYVDWLFEYLASS